MRKLFLLTALALLAPALPTHADCTALPQLQTLLTQWFGANNCTYALPNITCRKFPDQWTVQHYRFELREVEGAYTRFHAHTFRSPVYRWPQSENSKVAYSPYFWWPAEHAGGGFCSCNVCYFPFWVAP